MAEQFLWANPQVLVDKGYDETDSINAVVSASWLLWSLSGRRLHVAGTKRDTYELAPGGRRKIKLLTTPVDTVLDVRSIDPWDATAPASGVAYATGTWAQVGRDVRFTRSFISGGWIRAADPRLIPEGMLVQIDYTVKDNVPPGTQSVVLYLAEQYLLAANDLPCGLPDRIVSLTRPGITWTLLDAADFLNRGRTGIIRVDTWLMTVNPGGNKSKARVFDPAMPRLIESHWMTEPAHTTIDPGGVDTFTGHGPPDTDAIVGSSPGDLYVDLDTGTEYVLT